MTPFWARFFVPIVRRRGTPVSDAESTVRLEVSAGGDVLRQERLTRDLRDELTALEGIDIAFGAPDDPGGEDHKGTLETAVALIVTITTLRGPITQLLVTAIREWCARDGRRVVHLTDGDRSLEVVGNPTEAQQHVIGEFVRRSGDRDESGAPQ